MIAPDLLARLENAWQGEAFGKAMYATIAKRQNDAFRRWQWQTLYQLEVETGEALRQLLLRHGKTTAEDQASVRDGWAEAERIVDLPWDQMMHEFASDLPDIIREYEELERDCALKGEDASALRLLVNHEIASLAFARAEIEGASSASLAAVLSLLKSLPPLPS